MSKWMISLFFATLAILGRVGFYIFTPLWLDFFRAPSIQPYNITDGNTTNRSLVPLYPARSTIRTINVIFLLLGQYGFCAIFWGLTLVIIFIVAPKKLGHAERTFPVKYFVVMGVSQGLSSVLVNFAMSGSRTAPYLQAILSNFTIPIQFVIRFIILRRKPTRRKLLCTGLVLLAEFICLLPNIFPQLESAQAHADDGGSTGAGAILWPLCFVSSQIPFAIANVYMETSVEKRTGDGGSSVNDVNIAFFLFGWNAFILLAIAAFFWVDVIPGFGTSISFSNLGQQLLFNVRCLFGQEGCGPSVYLLGWGNFTAILIGSLAFACLMRYSEGANFVVIVLTLRTPLVFLFWTLFQESPFQWRPHLHLSTWLSIGAICVMLPAIYFYNTGEPERRVESTTRIVEVKSDDEDDETRHLLPNGHTNIQGTTGYTGIGGNDAVVHPYSDTMVN